MAKRRKRTISEELNLPWKNAPRIDKRDVAQLNELTNEYKAALKAALVAGRRYVKDCKKKFGGSQLLEKSRSRNVIIRIPISKEEANYLRDLRNWEKNSKRPQDRVCGPV